MVEGKVILTLDEYMKKHNISRSSLSRNGGLRYDTLLSYCRGDVTRLDIYTLTKICCALECDISDILKFKKK